jgi:SAM-dependent methyltransferase
MIPMMREKTLRAMADGWDERARHSALDAIDLLPTKKWEETADPIREFFEGGEEVLSHILTHLNFDLKSTERALDIGCGVGRFTRALKRTFDEVHGVDVSKEMIDRARVLNQSQAGLVFHHAPGDSLPMFPKDNFDLVFSYIVFQHIPDPNVTFNYLSEIGRVLRPNGTAVLHFWLGPDGKRDPWHPPFASRVKQFVRSILFAIGLTRIALAIQDVTVIVPLGKDVILDAARRGNLELVEYKQIPNPRFENVRDDFMIFQRKKGARS